MTTEMYMENYRLDLSKYISTLLTFGIDDLKDFSGRDTTWSKTIVLPGTANNNKAFGHIFQIGQSNPYNPAEPNVGLNFNASKSADCIIFQDNIQTFIGVLRLLQINITGGQIDYEVQALGKMSGLNVALSGALLEQLDFSAYDQVFSAANIIASWDNAPGSGLYYPLIDYGTYGRATGFGLTSGKGSWDIRTFRPALYVREYIDKMFTAAGFRWSSDLFDTARFKSLVVPHNQKRLTKLGSTLVSAQYTTDDFVFTESSSSPQSVVWNVFGGTDFTIDGPDQTITYGGANPITVNIQLAVVGNYESFSMPLAIQTLMFGEVLTDNLPPTGNNPISITKNITKTITPGATFRLDAIFAYTPTFETFILTLSSATLTITSSGVTAVNINPGDDVIINETIPKNIRQIDFLVSIVKLFNLFVYEDKYDPTLIYLKPYIDFYTTDPTDSVDWTYKLNRDKPFKIRPMSEINAKKYEFKYKADSDYYNETYRKRYGKGYGDYIFDSQFEFSEQTKAFELIFSSTPLVGYAGEDKVYPTIFKRTGSDDSTAEEENVDSNIRILQTKKITGVTSWDILNDATILDSVTDYGYAGHFDDPDAPSNDLNFGALAELFFTLVSGDLTVTQFNVYWSSYMAEITDKDSKLATGNFHLTAKDIIGLDFSRFVYLDGVLYRLNKVSDYNASIPTDCVVQLLKVNYLIY